MHVLVAAAFPPELSALRARLGDALRGPIAGRPIGGAAVGIGIPGAAVGAAAAIAELRPRAVVLVGTCGVYARAADRLPIGAVAVARRVLLVDPADVEGRAAFPDPMLRTLDADAAIADGLGAPGADVATTLAVTTEDALADRMARSSGCSIEHLEAFAVARACASAGVPFAAALGVANLVGASARAEWRANHRAAGDAAVARVLAWIEAGAAGLDR